MVVVLAAGATAAAPGVGGHHGQRLDGGADDATSSHNTLPNQGPSLRSVCYYIIMLPVNPKFYEYDNIQKKVSDFTPAKIKYIEESTLLKTVEKINLAALLLGYKHITDVAIGLENEEQIIEELQKLNLTFAKNYYYHEETKYEWIQVAINKPVLDYVIERREALTVLEAGVLYGYPISASLAYDGMLEKRWFDKSIAEYYLSGVFSKPYTENERAHFEKIWGHIIKVSPRLVAEALGEYKEYRQSNATSEDEE